MAGPTLYLAIIVAVLALILAAWLAPRWIALDSYRPVVATRLSTELGQNVTITGRISARLLPIPALVADGVKVAGAAGAPDLAEIPELELRPRLLPLLAGRVSFATAILPQARITVGTSFLPSIQIDASSGKITGLETDAPVIDGILALGGLDWALHGALKAPDQAGARAVSASLDSLAGRADLAGTWKEGALQGHLELRASALADRTIPGGALTLASGVSVARGNIDLTGLNLNLGGAPISGTAHLAPAGTPRLDLRLAGQKLDLDSWAKVTASLSMPTSGFALPKGMAASLDLAIGQLVFHGATLGSARLVADLTDGEITLDQASATLPGNSQFALFGFVDEVAGAPAFTGTVSVESARPGQAIAWLEGNRGDPAPLAAGRFDGSLRWHPGALNIDSGELHLGQDVIDLQAGIMSGSRTALDLSFTADTIDAGALAPALAGFPPSWLSGLSATIKGGVDTTRINGIDAKNLDLAMSWDGTRLALGDFSIGDLMGARLQVNGAIDPLAVAGLAPAGTSAQGLTVALATEHPERLAAWAGLTLPIRPEKLGPFALSGQVSAAGIATGAPTFTLTDVRLRAGAVTAGGAGNLTLGANPRLDASLTLAALSLDPLLAGNDAHSSPAKPAAGPPAPTAVPQLSVSVQSLTTPAQAATPSPPLGRLEAQIELAATAIDWNGMRFESPSVTLTSGKGGIAMRDLVAGLYGGRLTGAGIVGPDGMARLTLALAKGQADLLPLHAGGLSFARGAVDAAADLTFPAKPDWTGRLSGAGSFAITQGALKGLDLGHALETLAARGKAGILAVIASALSRGTTGFASLAGHFAVADGIAKSDDLRLSAPAGGIGATLAVDIPGHKIDLDARLVSGALGGLPLLLHLSGPWDKPNGGLSIGDPAKP